VSTEGIDIVLAIDASGSMQALDLDAERPIRERRNRLEVVKDVIARFVEKRESDQIGMVVFGSEAFTQCPLTLDHGIVATFIEGLELGVAGDATAIGDGLGTAVKRLKSSKAKSRVVVLLTDGEQNAGALSPEKAAEIAKTFGIRVYTVGAGTRGKAPVLVDTIFGKSIVEQDFPVDEAVLRRVAEITGGAYFRAEDTAGLASVYDQIDRLEKSEIVSQAYMEYDERFGVFVVPALALLLFEIGLLGTRLRKLP
jgi:Ca-activated chloride channel family protein